ncbi:MAG: PD-(D/E)XK nuclease family transposase, partial [Bacilli bacterium]|nr:PD-(D/E)XK nuclease family transposase [Bacilli bacterium]
MEKDKFYTCRYDRAFKEVFMEDSNKDLLKSLLESVLEVDVNDIEYLNLESNVDNVNVKRKHFDLNLNTSIGRVQVEVNSTNKGYIHPRNMSYICDTYSHHTLKGENYDEDTMIIQINFSYSLTD